MKFARLFQQLKDLTLKNKIRDFVIFYTILETKTGSRQVAPQSLSSKKRMTKTIFQSKMGLKHKYKRNLFKKYLIRIRLKKKEES